MLCARRPLQAQSISVVAHQSAGQTLSGWHGFSFCRFGLLAAPNVAMVCYTVDAHPATNPGPPNVISGNLGAFLGEWLLEPFASVFVSGKYVPLAQRASSGCRHSLRRGGEMSWPHHPPATFNIEKRMAGILHSSSRRDHRHADHLNVVRTGIGHPQPSTGRLLWRQLFSGLLVPGRGPARWRFELLIRTPRRYRTVRLSASV